MSAICSVCSKRPRATHRFCPHCGNPLQAAFAPQRKFVSVLFADLCDSTKLIAGLDPEQAQARLARPIELMSEAVRDFGGTISQVNGDGVLALFGAPLSQEDHALRACLAAGEIQQRVRSFVEGSVPLSVRVGIDSGDVFVGTVHQHLAQHYRADGDTVHIAKRLEMLAEPGSTLLTNATRQLAGLGIEVREIGWRRIRGLEGSTDRGAEGLSVDDGRAAARRASASGRRKVFALVTTSARSAAEPLAKRQTLAPMMGRHELLHDLDADLEEALLGGARIVGLEGSAGMGKSRLLSTLADTLRQRGVRVVALAPRAYAENFAHSLTASMLRSLFSGGPDARIPVAEAVATSLTAIGLFQSSRR